MRTFPYKSFSGEVSCPQLACCDGRMTLGRHSGVGTLRLGIMHSLCMFVTHSSLQNIAVAGLVSPREQS